MRQAHPDFRLHSVKVEMSRGDKSIAELALECLNSLQGMPIVHARFHVDGATGKPLCGRSRCQNVAHHFLRTENVAIPL